MDFEVEHVERRASIFVEDVQGRRESIIFDEEFDLRSQNFSIRKSSLHPSEQTIVEDVLEESEPDENEKITSQILKKRTCVIVQGLIFIISLTVLINVLFLGYIDKPTDEVEVITCELQDVIGDGYCDDEANTFICKFDGGDCCGDNVLAGNCHQCMCLSKFTDQNLRVKEFLQ